MNRRTFVLSAVAAVSPLGCAAFARWLPTVISALTESNVVLDAIEATALDHFARNPDAEAERKFRNSMTRARASLAAAADLAKAADAVSREDIAAAFDAFERAYADLLLILGPLGIVAPSETGTLSQGDGGPLLVPSARDLVGDLSE